MRTLLTIRSLLVRTTADHVIHDPRLDLNTLESLLFSTAPEWLRGSRSVVGQGLRPLVARCPPSFDFVEGQRFDPIRLFSFCPSPVSFVIFRQSLPFQCLYPSPRSSYSRIAIYPYLITTCIRFPSCIIISLQTRLPIYGNTSIERSNHIHRDAFHVY